MQNFKLMIEYTKDLNILYVEDDLALQVAIQELLKNFFSHIDFAHDGQDGLDKYTSYYKKNSFYYDIVITDISMPIMNGLKMSRSIVKINPMQSIIITTAYNDQKYLSEAIDIGVTGFITKPFDIQKLTQILYKTSQAISDHKYVLSHIELMENLNIRLEAQNRELISKNIELEKSSRMLDIIVHKEQYSQPQDENKTKELQADNYLIEQIDDLINNDLSELEEIHEEIDLNVINIINNVELIDIHSLSNLVNQFSRYAAILSMYNLFDKIGASMTNFAKTLKDNHLPSDQKSVENIFILLESFIFVLGKWQNDLASSDETIIKSLDASIISDMDTIINMWIQKEEEHFEEDLDSIFDF